MAAASSLAAQLDNLNDQELQALASSLNPAKRRALAAALKDASKRPRTVESAVPDMLRYYRALELLDTEKGADWRRYLHGWLLTNSEERTNVSAVKDRNDPVARWRSDDDVTNSTVYCLAPRRNGDLKPSGKKPGTGSKMTEGYVYFKMPAFWKDLFAEIAREKGETAGEVPFQSVVLSRMMILANCKTEDDVPADDYESSHICGNEWCWLHLAPETKAHNQDRGTCFKWDPESLGRDCQGHGGTFPHRCIRAVEASRRVMQLRDNQWDTRPEVELPIARQWWDDRDRKPGTLAKGMFAQLSKAGGGKSALKKFIEKGAKYVSTPLKAKFMQVFGGGQGTSRF